MVRLWLEYCTQWDHGILELGNFSFILGSHGYKTFFHQFQNISLKQLLVLNIENNNITSLEMIQNLDAPNLDCLYMHGNPIVSVKSLRKANFPKLTRIYISTVDLIQQMRPITKPFRSCMPPICRSFRTYPGLYRVSTGRNAIR